MKTSAELRFVLLLLIAIPSGAQAQSAGRALTWQDCLAIAARSNPDLASSTRALEAGKDSYYGSFNGLLPQLSVSNSVNDSKGSDESSRWQAEGTASLNIWSAGQLANIKSASAGVTQAQANLRLASANLRLSLRKAFAQLLFAQQNEEVSKTILDMRQKSAQLVELRYDSGRESKGNMLRSQAQSLQAQVDLAQARRDLRTSQKSLDRQLGLDEFSPLAATGALEAQAPPDLPNDMQSLLVARPDVWVQEAAIKSAQATVSSARSSLWPSLSANYTRSRLGKTEFPTNRYNWTAGATLSLPIFSGGPTALYFSVAGAKKNLEKAEEELRSVRNGAMLDLESSWSGFAGAVDQVKVQIALLESARQRNDEADVRYASGLLSYDNWEIIASDRISSERQVISARLAAVNAEALWSKAIGKTLGE